MDSAVFQLSEVAAERQETGRAYREFLRVPALSAGLYVLPAGGTDPQKPHREDEVYYVGAGRAKIHVAGEDRPVMPGSVIYVEAGVDHRFHSIEEDLHVVVFWSPPRAEATI